MSELPLVPWPTSPGMLGEAQKVLQGHIEATLKALLQELRAGTLTYERAVCGLGYIEGHYAFLRHVHEQIQKLQG